MAVVPRGAVSGDQTGQASRARSECPAERGLLLNMILAVASGDSIDAWPSISAVSFGLVSFCQPPAGGVTEAVGRTGAAGCCTQRAATDPAARASALRRKGPDLGFEARRVDVCR